MGDTLSLGYVALTPINLNMIPGPLEGSKAGQLSLFWANVKAANKAYVQPVNLLWSYQTGQFTTVQAVLVDNSQVSYAVSIVSQSTGQRVVVNAYSQQMTPLLVSVAPSFVISLLIPTGTVSPVDQVETLFWFLNTPQIPFSTTGLHTSQTLTTLASGTVAAPSGMAYGQASTVATLAPAFSQGAIYYTYVSITATLTITAPFLYLGTNPDSGTLSIQTEHGGTVTYHASMAVPQTLPSGGLSQTFTFSFPANVTDTTGDAILLQVVPLSNTSGTTGSSMTVGFSLSYSFYYSITQP